MRLHRLISTIFMWLFVTPVSAQVLNPFSMFPIGARAFGMQGAMAAASVDYSGTFYNPASIAFMQYANLGLMHTDMSLQRTLDVLGVVSPVTYRNVIAGSFGSYTIRNIEARRSNTLRPDYLFNSYVRMGWLSYAYRFHRRFALGINFKLLSSRLDYATAFGTGIDVGIMLKMNNRLHLAMVSQDLAASFNWDTHLKEHIMPVHLLGFAFYPLSYVLLSGDVSQVGSRYTWAVGTEVRMIGALLIRSGLDERAASFGGGISLPLSNQTFLLLNYAYTPDPIVLGEYIHAFDINVRLF